MQRVDPKAAAAALDEYWSQKVLGEANGNLFKVAKGIGSTNWHPTREGGKPDWSYTDK